MALVQDLPEAQRLGHALQARLDWEEQGAACLDLLARLVQDDAATLKMLEGGHDTWLRVQCLLRALRPPGIFDAMENMLSYVLDEGPEHFGCHSIELALMTDDQDDEAIGNSIRTYWYDMHERFGLQCDWRNQYGLADPDAEPPAGPECVPFMEALIDAHLKAWRAAVQEAILDPDSTKLDEALRRR